MKGDRIPVKVLSAKIIPDAHPAILEKYGIDKSYRSLAIFTCDSDDVGYTALDEATKYANVDVVYAKSFYAGADNANTRLAGEFIGILASYDVEEVRSGLNTAIDFAENKASFYSACDDNSVIYYAQCVSQTGNYLSKMAKVKAGQAMAYLIAPPLEAMVALDAAMKIADVELNVTFAPPTETNFAGALLTGEQFAVKSACDAFADKVCEIANNPLAY